MSATGEISLAAGYEDKPGIGAQEIADLTLEGFWAGARSGDYKAIALCVDVRVDPPDGSGKTDAIRVTVEENGQRTIRSSFNGDAQQIVGRERPVRFSQIA
jgi:hypothetical protein